LELRHDSLGGFAGRLINAISVPSVFSACRAVVLGLRGGQADGREDAEEAGGWKNHGTHGKAGQQARLRDSEESRDARLGGVYCLL
ncbi:MAG: hypothetical protein ACKO9H_01500, partial [Planctomycetota bacterium]